MGIVKPTLIAATPMVAVLIWLVAIMLDSGPYHPNSVLLTGLGWLVLTTVATVGLVLVGGRWALRTLIVMLATTLWVGVVIPLSAWTMAGFGASATGLILLLSPHQHRLIRKLPSAGGVPDRSVVVTLAALGLPLALGLILADPNLWVIVMGTSGPIAALLYSRTIPGGLAALRFGLISASLALAVVMPVSHAVVAVLVSAAICATAWSPDVAIAFRPLVEKGTSYAIPPELAPKEILDRAGIDEKGRAI